MFSPPDRLVIGRPLKVAGAIFGVIIAAALAFAVFEPIQVLPRIRQAPGYALQDQSGELFTSETARGSLTLYSFVPLDCDARCDGLHATMRELGPRLATEVELGATPMNRVTIVLDDDPTPSDVARAATLAGADGTSWRWLSGEEDRLRTVVGSGFQRYFEAQDDGSIRFDPAFVLVDGAGVIRGEYRYQTLADDTDKLVHHIDILAAEIRHADGATAVAYEAAHLFLCYP